MPFRSPKRIARALFAAYNCGDSETLRKLFAPHAVLIENFEHRIEGADKIVELAQRLSRIEAMPIVEVQTMAVVGADVLVTGAFRSDDPRISGRSRWQVTVENGKVTALQNFWGEGDTSLIRIGDQLARYVA